MVIYNNRDYCGCKILNGHLAIYFHLKYHEGSSEFNNSVSEVSDDNMNK